MKINYRRYKLSFPYICEGCGYLHWHKAHVCEGCGEKSTIRETNKKDYKIWKSERK